MATFRTYGSILTKVARDLDLLDEIFIQAEEFVGYIDEAIKEASAEIITLHKDYFLTNVLMNMSPGQTLFSFPSNIYANKIRGIVYVNGCIIYTIRQYLQMYKFEDIAYTYQFGAADEYRYIYRNDSPGNPQAQLIPPSRDSGQYMYFWYLRESARVPQLGEFYNSEPILPSAISGNTIAVLAGTFPSPTGFILNPVPYVTGDQVQVFTDPLTVPSTLPGGLVAGTSYFVIVVSAGVVALATTLANALANTPITITSAPTGRFVMTVAGTVAIQQNSIIDIPEFYEFLIQWMKVRCLEKEGDPRYEAAVSALQSQRKIMVDTLTEMIEDNANELEGDFSNYLEMS